MALQFAPVATCNVAGTSAGAVLAVPLLSIPKNATGGTGVVDKIQFTTTTGTFDAGSIKVYGIV